MRRFFQSKLEDSALKAKGTYDLKVQKQRRKNRVVKVCVRSGIYHGALFIIMSVLHFTRSDSPSELSVKPRHENLELFPHIQNQLLNLELHFGHLSNYRTSFFEDNSFV